MAVPNIALNNGTEIPQLGFGVFQIDPADTAAAVKSALDVGYRHIDTAEMYGNEKEVADGIEAAGVSREDVWITSKINNGFHGYDNTLRAFDQTLTDLRIEQIDLILIHWPLPAAGDFVGTWKALESVYADGRARAIGVSNFQSNHLGRLFAECTVVPAVNQIELHPYLTQEAMRAFDAEHNIVTEAWSPIAQGNVLDDPIIKGIAAEHGKSTAQVVLRWHVQLGNVIFPKSVTETRVRENFEIFDFELSPADMGFISALNRDERTGPNPDDFNYIPD